MTEARWPDSRRVPTARPTPGAPCWVSLMVHDLAATREFYAALFGWTYEPGPQQLGPYVRALLNGHEVAGIGQLPPDRRLPIAWTPYLASDDVDETAETARHCGGTVGVGPLTAAEAGRLAIASDPAGAVFGIWQAAEHLGTGVAGVHGTPVWNELLTRETAEVAKFYRTLFGYTEEASGGPGMDRLTFLLEGRAVASVRGVGSALPRDRGAHWMTFFEAADVDAAVQRVLELGGHVVRPARTRAHGRVATVADPEGAVFSLLHAEPSIPERLRADAVTP
ncbi:VOC family protein [Streptomyces longispororuber]|uniref:VOC family protein n=1 Tax=Streptomyces TaxID=1883 RepID=UPI0024A80844|nr:VOC family protein [Streptomyces sp. CC224B]